MLKAIGHPIRLRMLAKLGEAEFRMTVTEIFTALDIEQAIASHHLGILTAAKVVVREREGKYAYYKIASTEIGNIIFHCLEINHA